MSSSTYTAIDSYYQTCKRFGITPVYQTHATLNDYLGVLPGEQGADLTGGITQYLAVGNGAHGIVDQVNSYGISTKHRSGQFTGLYNIIPWVLREATNDLTDVERLNYRMRRIETHNGISYVAYYLKKFEIVDTTPSVSVVTSTAETSNTVPYAFSPADQVHRELASTVTGTLRNLVVELPIEINLTSTEITELENALTTLYGNGGLRVISEFGLYTATEKNTVDSINGVMTSYSEVVNAYLSISVSSSKLLDISDGTSIKTLRLGNSFTYTP